MKVLVHRVAPGTLPVGVWWLPKHRSQPRSFYLDPDRYTAGAVSVLGDEYDGEPLSLAQWENRANQLAGSANPFTTWTVEETDEDPRLLLIQPKSKAA